MATNWRKVPAAVEAVEGLERVRWVTWAVGPAGSSQAWFEACLADAAAWRRMGSRSMAALWLARASACRPARW